MRQRAKLFSIISQTVAAIWRFDGFQNVIFKFLTVGEVKRPILHQCTKFRKDRSNHCGDIAIFVIFEDGSRRHLGFSKFENLLVWLENAYLRPKIWGFGGISSQNEEQYQ